MNDEEAALFTLFVHLCDEPHDFAEPPDVIDGPIARALCGFAGFTPDSLAAPAH
jgi:hypothetical protein